MGTSLVALGKDFAEDLRIPEARFAACLWQPSQISEQTVVGPSCVMWLLRREMREVLGNGGVDLNSDSRLCQKSVACGKIDKKQYEIPVVCSTFVPPSSTKPHIVGPRRPASAVGGLILKLYRCQSNDARRRGTPDLSFNGT